MTMWAAWKGGHRDDLLVGVDADRPPDQLSGIVLVDEEPASSGVDSGVVGVTQ